MKKQAITTGLSFATEEKATDRGLEKTHLSAQIPNVSSTMEQMPNCILAPNPEKRLDCLHQQDSSGLDWLQ